MSNLSVLTCIKVTVPIRLFGLEYISSLAAMVAGCMNVYEVMIRHNFRFMNMLNVVSEDYMCAVFKAQCYRIYK